MNILLLMPFKIYEGWPFPIGCTVGNIPSSTLPQLASVIDKYHNIKIIDAINLKIHFKKFESIIKKTDIVGISISNPYLALDAEICIKLIRNIKPEIKIIMGGHHPTFYAERCLDIGADIVVRYEGESTFKEVIRSIENKTELIDVKGIVFKKDQKYIFTKDREFIKNIDDIPIPNWKLLDFSQYNIFLPGKGKTATLEFSRGCIHKCKFCQVNAMWKKTQRTKSAKRAIKELDHLYLIGVRKLLITDDNFACHKNKTQSFLNYIISKKYNIKFAIFVRVDTILHNKNIFKLAKQAGLKVVFIGFESKIQKDIDKMGKGLKDSSVLNYKEVYKFLSSLGITVIGFYLTSYIDQSNDYAEKNFKYNPTEICDYLSVNSYVPLKGTKAFEIFKNKKIKLKDMFYHLQGFTSYELQEQKYYKNIFYSVKLFLSIDLIKNVFSNNKVLRCMFRVLYWAYLKNFFSMTIKNFCDFCILQNPFLSKQQRQNWIIRRYTNNRYIRDLINKNKYIGRKIFYNR